MADSGSTQNLAQPVKTDAPAAQAQEEKETRRQFNYPLVRFCDMSEEVRVEAVDMVVTAVEKHIGNYEAASKTIKESMDKRAGSSWHVVVGEGFGFEITHEMKNLLYMYFGGNLGILVWKAS
ncbi:dynein light chain type 1-domain-containing protein [Gorgonomyces haynaldii]|nr:dynein light chain type 1-domain-containing protein [Gorgonomyces haynaldii]